MHITLILPLRQFLAFQFPGFKIFDNRVIISIPGSFLLRIHTLIHSASITFQSSFCMNLIFFIRHFQVINKVHILEYVHLLFGSSYTAFIFIIEIFRQWKLHLIKRSQVTSVGHPCTVRGFMMQQQTERFFFLPFVLQPFQRQVRSDIGGIPFYLHFLTIIYKIRIVIITLTNQNIPIIESRGIRGKMPFTNNSSLITCLLQQLREGLLASVKPMRIIYKTILMAMFSRQHTRTAGPAYRVCHKTIGKDNSFIADTVDIGCLYKTVIVGTNSLK